MDGELKKQLTATISRMLDTLESAEELSEADCAQVIEDMKKLHRQHKTTITVAAEVAEPNASADYSVQISPAEIPESPIRDAYSVFTTKITETTVLLDQMRSLITSEKIPEDAELTRLNDTLSELRDSYGSIREIAEAQLASEELPEDGSPASAYVDAVRKSIEEQANKQMTHITDVLLDFLSVQSKVKKYAEELRPFQDSAETLLTNLQADSTPDFDALQNELAGPELFLDTVRCEDIDSDEGIALLEQIDDYFTDWIKSGLAGGKYFLGERRELSAEAGKEATVVVAQDMEEKEKKSESDDPDPLEIRERDVTYYLDQGSEDLGRISLTTYVLDEGKIQANTFLRDMKKGNEKVNKEILHRAFYSLFLTEDLLVQSGLKQHLVSVSLSYLVSKGYLKKCYVSPYGKFYFATKRILQAMSLKKVREALRVDKSEENIKKNIAVLRLFEYQSVALASLAEARLIYDAKQRYIDAGYECDLIKETGFSYFDSFVTKIYPANKSAGANLLVGIFWIRDGFLSSPSDFEPDHESYANELKSEILAQEDQIDVQRIDIAAINLDIGKELANTLFTSRWFNMLASSVYIYSITENRYYSYDVILEHDMKEFYKTDAGREFLKKSMGLQNTYYDAFDLPP